MCYLYKRSTDGCFAIILRYVTLIVVSMYCETVSSKVKSLHLRKELLMTCDIKRTR